MIPLRYSRLWLSIGCLLTGLVVYLSLTSNPPDMAVPGGDKLGHFLAYGTLMGWFVLLFPRPIYPRLALFFILMGVSLEVLQGMGGYRSFEYLDMLANTGGVLLGWSLIGLTPLALTLVVFERWIMNKKIRLTQGRK
ncbi:MAG: VanZ family protein [Gammaproteobacteria bacterium]|nr:VanZ family protein [Gammaproteobacteria bacterium]